MYQHCPVSRRATRFLLVLFASALCVLAACEARCRPGQVLLGDRCRPASEILDAGTDASAPPDAGRSEHVAKSQGSEGTPSSNEQGPRDGGGSSRDVERADATVKLVDLGKDAGTQGNPIGGSRASLPPCSGDASVGEESCDGVDNDCDGETDEALTCTPVSDPCSGVGERSVCDENGVLIQCGASGTATAMTSCKSARHCQAGKDRGSCALCLVGTEEEYACDGVQLTRCNDNGDEYVPVKTCSTEALCNPVAGDCTAAACGPGQMRCSGNDLHQCNSDQTAFELVETCGEGLCDAAAGACNVCVPLSARCEARGVSVVCDAEGTQIDRQECPADKPICAGEGECVECGAASDCSVNERCESGRCTCPGSPDLTSDRNNCGSCGNGCSPNEDCVLGRCEVYCGGANILTDRTKCGVTCRRCDANETCRDGSCEPCGDINADENNCGECGKRCESGMECVQGRCEAVSRCGDGALDVEAGEQCDPGQDAAGCNRCRITGIYGDHCSTPGPTTVGGYSAICFSFGSGGASSAPMILPLCSPDGRCPSIPGANWTTACAASTGGPNGTCYLPCSSGGDCPPEYECVTSNFCWKP